MKIVHITIIVISASALCLGSFFAISWHVGDHDAVHLDTDPWSDAQMIKLADTLDEVKAFKKIYPERQAFVGRTSSFGVHYQAYPEKNESINYQGEKLSPYVDLHVAFSRNGAFSANSIYCIPNYERTQKMYERDWLVHYKVLPSENIIRYLENGGCFRNEDDQVLPRGDLFLRQPLRIEGLNETQYVGQKIDFTVKFNGTGYDCGYPKLKIEDSRHKTVWQSGNTVHSCDPDTKNTNIEKEWRIGASPLGVPVINRQGYYTLFAEFGNDIMQYGFWVVPQIVDIAVSPDGVESNTYSPAAIKVKIGYNNTVRWTNHGQAPTKIDADTAEDLNFFEATIFDVNLNSFLAPGKSFEFQFGKDGTFGYHGKPWQRGSVIVLPPDDAVIQLQIQPPDTLVDKDYSIKSSARKGYLVSWYNIDNKTHTVTSKADNGKTFDSGPIPPYDAVFTLDTSSMAPGYYQYGDKLNPDLSDTIRIIDPAEFDDGKLVENAKNLKEVKEFLAKYPEAFSHVDHDYYDMLSYGVINKTIDSYRSIWLRVVFDEFGGVQRTSIDCGFGGMTLDAPNVLEYLKVEKCLDR